MNPTMAWQKEVRAWARRIHEAGLSHGELRAYVLRWYARGGYSDVQEGALRTVARMRFWKDGARAWWRERLARGERPEADVLNPFYDSDIDIVMSLREEARGRG